MIIKSLSHPTLLRGWDHLEPPVIPSLWSIIIMMKYHYDESSLWWIIIMMNHHWWWSADNLDTLLLDGSSKWTWNADDRKNEFSSFKSSWLILIQPMASWHLVNQKSWWSVLTNGRDVGRLYRTKGSGWGCRSCTRTTTTSRSSPAEETPSSSSSSPSSTTSTSTSSPSTPCSTQQREKEAEKKDSLDVEQMHLWICLFIWPQPFCLLQNPVCVEQMDRRKVQIYGEEQNMFSQI